MVNRDLHERVGEPKAAVRPSRIQVYRVGVVESPYHYYNGIKKRGLLPKMIVVVGNALNTARKYAP